MNNTKLVLILRVLSKKELDSLTKFISSPYFLKRKELIRFFEIIKDFYPAFDDEKFNCDYLYKKMYPGKKTNEGVIRKLISELYKMAEEFLLIERVRNCADDTYKADLLDEYTGRNISRLFDSTYKNIEENLSKVTDRDPEYYYLNYKLNFRKVNHLLQNGEQHLISPHLNNAGKDLVYYFLIKIFDLSHNLLVNKNLLNYNTEYNFADGFLENLDTGKLVEQLKIYSHDDFHIPAMYYHLCFAYSMYNDDFHFEEGKKLFYDNYRSFSIVEKYNLYLYLENCCTNRIINGRDEYIRIVFELYRDILDNGLYKINDDEPMPIDFFRNALITALKLKEYEWAATFIENYKRNLPVEQQTNMYNYSCARLYTEQNKFEPALVYLNKVKYDYFLFKNDVKNMMLKCYYELGHIEEAFSLIDTYKHFLSKNKMVSESNKLSNLNFLRFFSELLNAKTGKPIECRHLLAKINETANITNKQWLVEKLSQFSQ